MIVKQSINRRQFAIKNTVTHSGYILPSMPLNIGFDAEFNAEYAGNDAKVALFEECDHFDQSIPFMGHVLKQVRVVKTMNLFAFRLFILNFI